jgi:type I restriction enzyme S subunit
MVMEQNEISEGWCDTTIGEFSPLQRGFDLPNRDRILGDFPVVYSNGIVNYHNTFQVKGPVVDDNYWPHNTSLWVTNFNKSVPKYVYYLLKSVGLIRFASGSGVPTLNRNDAHGFKIRVPSSKEEQTAIANALSDVDALIASIEKLIAKKQAIKTATMQQLLTGKKRLPPFDKYQKDGEDGTRKGQSKGSQLTELGEIPEDWEVCKLEDAANFLDGQRRPVKSGERAKMQGIYPYYGASGIVDYVNDFIFDGEFILLGEDGENILSRSSPLAFKAEGKIWVNNHAHVMQPKDSFNIDFLREYLESLDYSLLNSGTAQPKLNKQSCLNINVIKPSLDEQIVISDVLTGMDSDLLELKKRLTKTKQIKQGMMQELLTGKTRLPVTNIDGTKK